MKSKDILFVSCHELDASLVHIFIAICWLQEGHQTPQKGALFETAGNSISDQYEDMRNTKDDNEFEVRTFQTV